MKKVLSLMSLTTLIMTGYANSAEPCGTGDWIIFAGMVTKCAERHDPVCAEAIEFGLKCGWSYTPPAIKE